MTILGGIKSRQSNESFLSKHTNLQILKHSESRADGKILLSDSVEVKRRIEKSEQKNSQIPTPKLFKKIPCAAKDPASNKKHSKILVFYLIFEPKLT